MPGISRTQSGIALVVASLLFVIMGCRVEDDASSKRDAAFEAHLEVRGLNDSEIDRERERQLYEQKLSVASAILATGEIDRRLVDAEVENFRTELVIKRFFDEVFERELSESKLRHYYRDNASKFGRTWLRFSIFSSIDTSDKGIDRLLEGARQGAMRSEVAAKADGTDFANDGIEPQYLDELDAELRQLFFAANEGDVIGPLLKDGVVTVYRIEQGPISEGDSYESVRQQIKFILRNQVRQREMERLLEINSK